MKQDVANALIFSGFLEIIWFYVISATIFPILGHNIFLVFFEQVVLCPFTKVTLVIYPPKHHQMGKTTSTAELQHQVF
jgi:hypothetical protein